MDLAVGVRLPLALDLGIDHPLEVLITGYLRRSEAKREKRGSRLQALRRCHAAQRREWGGISEERGSDPGGTAATKEGSGRDGDAEGPAEEGSGNPRHLLPY